MNLFEMAYTVLGGLGIFFFGMKSMSEALQSAAGDVIKRAIDTITKHRIYSVGVGIVVTMIVQSSSVTTVMVVGFVNAGLMNLTQAIGVIFGANIGTTITALLAAVGANITAKRAARAHAIFNMLGVLVIFLIFPYYLELIDWIVPGDPNQVNALGDKPNIAVHIATGHSIFNVTATLIFLPFL